MRACLVLVVAGIVLLVGGTTPASPEPARGHDKVGWVIPSESRWHWDSGRREGPSAAFGYDEGIFVFAWFKTGYINAGWLQLEPGLPFPSRLRVVLNENGSVTLYRRGKQLLAALPPKLDAEYGGQSIIFEQVK